MAYIGLNKSEYETLTQRLSFNLKGMDIVPSSNLTIGSNVSETMTAYYETFYELVELLRLYKWSMEHMVQGMEEAGDEIEVVDQEVQHYF